MRERRFGRMRWAGWVAGVLVAVLGGQAWGAGGATTRPARVTIATYNINWGIEGLPWMQQVMQSIRESGAQVVAIQEGNRSVYDQIRRQFGREYPHMLFYAGEGGSGFGWVSKLPLGNPRRLARQFGLFDTYMVDIEVGGLGVQIVNVHLQPTALDEDGGVRSVLRALGEGDAIRKQEIERICSFVRADRPAIVLGDFNSLSIFAAPRYMRERGFVDSFASVNKDAESQVTWVWGEGARQWKYRVDYIWHTEGLRTLRSRVIQRNGSDHRLVVSELERATGATSRPTTQTAER